MPEEGDAFPTRTEVRRARKTELQEWCREFDLDDSGIVVELRERLLDFLESLEEEEAELEEEIEVVEEAEEEVYMVRQKPVLAPEATQLLALRARLQKRRPNFRRQEWFRYHKLGEKWRRPRGRHSKLRRHLKYRSSLPSVGYRGPRETRGLHPSGFREVLVHKPEDLEGLDSKTQAARIGHAVGTRKRISIQDRADELGIRILNRVVE
ncbi:MAG: 50S ribosomal protein L32e [Thermoplasmata archaeon]